MPEEIKKIELSNRLFIALAILIGVLVLTYVAGVVINFKNLPGNEPRYLTVSGEGKVYTIPDIAAVDISIINTGNEKSDIPTMIKKNAEKMNAFIGYLKNLGIDEKDIKTTQYNLVPQYNWTEYQGQIFIGYKITNTILVKIRDFTKIGDVLDGAANEEASSIGNVSFTVEDTEKAKQEARTKAIEQAKEKAQSMIKGTGLKLGKVIDIQEGYYPVYNYSAMKGAGESAVPAVPQIEPGQQEVNITVNLTYRIK